MERNLWISLIVLSVLFLAFAYVVQASISVYHESHAATYDQPLAGIVYIDECADTIGAAEQLVDTPHDTTTCEVSSDTIPMGMEGWYYMKIWSGDNPEVVTKPGYFVNYDDNSSFCEGGGYDWHTDADFGRGECCGDDSGLLVKKWDMIATVNETGIPVDMDVPGVASAAISYDVNKNGGNIIEEEGYFTLPYDQDVHYEFYVPDCYLTDTVVYAQILTEGGNPATSDEYVFYKDSSDPCAGYERISGAFHGVAGTEYALKLYKGITDIGKYGGVGGFSEMSLQVTYGDILPIEVTKTRKFSKEVTTGGTHIINAKATEGGALDIDSIQYHVVPDSFITIGDVNILSVDLNKEWNIEIEITLEDFLDENGGDCAITYGGVICFDNDMNDGNQDGSKSWGWLDAYYEQGRIIDMGCLGMSAVSDGSNWIVCRDEGTIIPDEPTDDIRCDLYSGYVDQEGDICYRRTYNTMPCDDADPDTGQCQTTASLDICTDYSGRSDDYLNCPQAQCLKPVDCEPGKQGYCGLVEEGTSCAENKTCTANGVCRDMTCAERNGTCYTSTSSHCSGQIIIAPDCTTYQKCCVGTVQASGSGVGGEGGVSGDGAGGDGAGGDGSGAGGDGGAGDAGGAGGAGDAGGAGGSGGSGDGGDGGDGGSGVA